MGQKEMTALEDSVRGVVNAIVDPETGMSLGEMRMIKELKESEPGIVTVKFKPTSPFCPIALKIALDIKNAAASVEGVRRALVYCRDHVMESAINKTVNEAEAFRKANGGASRELLNCQCAWSNDAGLTDTPPPFLVSYAITQECNLKCRHCYSDASDEPAPDELSSQESRRLLDELADWGIRLLIFDGGEPLCREDFYEIASYASAKGLRVVVGSNATLIDAAAAVKMQTAVVQAVAISIDGAKPETHDRFRGEEGAFSKALNGAKACKEAGLPFQFNVVIRKRSLPEVPDILQLAVDSGAIAAEFFDLVQVKRVKQQCAEEVLSVDERRKVMEWLAEAQTDCPIMIRVPACPMYPIILKQKNIQPKKFPANLLHRIPYYDRGMRGRDAQRISYHTPKRGHHSVHAA